MFESEVQRRKGITTETVESLHRELDSLIRQQREEREAEARAFRLATRVRLNEDVFNQEIGLIQTRQRWIEEQLHRVQSQISDMENYSFAPEAIDSFRDWLESRLASVALEDRRFVRRPWVPRAWSSPTVAGSWSLECLGR